MKKRVLGLVLACVLGMACLAGCGGNNAAPGGTAPSASSEISAGNETAAGGEEVSAPGETDPGQTDQGQAETIEKIITVEVTHANGDVKELTYTTTEEMFGTLIINEGLVVGYQDKYGLVMEEVDGERAVYEEDNAYWALTINGEYAQTGADSTPVVDGNVYGLVYTPAEAFEE